MKRKGLKVLNGVKWLYVIGAILAVIFAVVVGCLDKIPDELLSIVPKDTKMDAKTFLVAYFACNAAIEVWFFWLLNRFINGKSNGTFYIFLLILSLIGSIVTLFSSTSISTINIILDVIVLYFAILARKDTK